jgi:hypothetical protein
LGHFSFLPTTFTLFLPPLPPYPNPSHFQAEPVLPLSLLLKRRHKHIKKDIAFLLAEIRTAIQRDS